MTGADVTGQLAEEIAGWPIGSGYYGTSIGTDEAREIAAALAPTVNKLIAEAAAAELDAAAADAGRWSGPQAPTIVRTWLRARAAAVRDGQTGGGQ